MKKCKNEKNQIFFKKWIRGKFHLRKILRLPQGLPQSLPQGLPQGLLHGVSLRQIQSNLGYTNLSCTKSWIIRIFCPVPAKSPPIH